jgi:hypothetical protein
LICKSLPVPGRKNLLNYCDGQLEQIHATVKQRGSSYNL